MVWYGGGGVQGRCGGARTHATAIITESGGSGGLFRTAAGKVKQMKNTTHGNRWIFSLEWHSATRRGIGEKQFTRT